MFCLLNPFHMFCMYIILIYGSRWSSLPFLWWAMAPMGRRVQSPLPVLCCNKQTKIFPRKFVWYKFFLQHANKTFSRPILWQNVDSQETACAMICCTKQRNKQNCCLFFVEHRNKCVYSSMPKLNWNNVQRTSQMLDFTKAVEFSQLSNDQLDICEVELQRICLLRANLHFRGSPNCQRDLTSFKGKSARSNIQETAIMVESSVFRVELNICVVNVDLQRICRFTANLHTRGLRPSHSCQRKLLAKTEPNDPLMSFKEDTVDPFKYIINHTNNRLQIKCPVSCSNKAAETPR